ncbi:MutS protein msh4 [Thecaphora frezii]
MRATAFTLSLASSRSLVILDELGRGTSPEEGVAIAQAVSEELIRRRSFAYLATHFLELATTLSLYSRVQLVRFQITLGRSVAEPSEPFQMVFHHKLQLGHCEEVYYGLELAKLANLPPGMLRRAYEMTQVIEARRREATKDSAVQQNVTIRRRLVRELIAHLKRIVTSYDELDDEDVELGAYLMELQQDFVNRIAETFSEGQGSERKSPAENA